MAYLLSNTCTKNYWNWTTIVEIIGSGWVVSFFLGHSVYFMYTVLGNNCRGRQD